VSILFNENTREVIREKAPSSLAILPVGATEQHGPHLPTGTDTFAVEWIAREAARLISDKISVFVAPTLPFGSSHHHLPFSGTFSFTTETYFRVVSELVDSLLIDGFTHVFVLNGHGGNNELIQLAIRDMAQKKPAKLAAASYWTIAWNALSALEPNRFGGVPGHAGAFETSLVQALRPDLVVEPRPQRDVQRKDLVLTPQYRLERTGSWQEIDGYSDSPANGDGERGQHYLDTIAGAVAAAFTEFFSAPSPILG
jgi:creatinine amidohydrolase